MKGTFICVAAASQYEMDEAKEMLKSVFIQ